MAATLAIDAVPASKRALARDVRGLQIVTQVALFRTGTMRRILARPR